MKMWSQIIFLILALISFSVHLSYNGKPRGNYNAGAAFIDLIITLGLLYWGGFFNVFFK